MSRWSSLIVSVLNAFISFHLFSFRFFPNLAAAKSSKKQLNPLLNNAKASFEGLLLKFTRPGKFAYMSTRNNKFSNRSQKGILTVVRKWFSILTFSVSSIQFESLLIVFDFRNNERKLSANFRSAISDLLQAKLKVREDNKKGKQRFRREGRGKQEQSGMTTLWGPRGGRKYGRLGVWVSLLPVANALRLSQWLRGRMMQNYARTTTVKLPFKIIALGYFTCNEN